MPATEMPAKPVSTNLLLCINVPDVVCETLHRAGYGLDVGEFSIPKGLKIQSALTSLRVVLIDTSMGKSEVFSAIHSVRSLLGASGGDFRVLCYSDVPRNPHFVLELERRGARYVRISNPEMLIECIGLLYAELDELARNGPQFRIIHRYSQGSCAPGEEITAVELFHRQHAFHLRLSLSQRFVFNLLAQSRSAALDAFQIAAGLNGWFYRDHARNSGKGYTTKVRVATVKVLIQRIREAMAACFAEADLHSNPYDALRSFYAEGSRRALYRLYAGIHWEHRKD